MHRRSIHQQNWCVAVPEGFQSLTQPAMTSSCSAAVFEDVYLRTSCTFGNDSRMNRRSCLRRTVLVFATITCGRRAVAAQRGRRPLQCG